MPEAQDNELHAIPMTLFVRASDESSNLPWIPNSNCYRQT